MNSGISGKSPCDFPFWTVSEVAPSDRLTVLLSHERNQTLQGFYGGELGGQRPFNV